MVWTKDEVDKYVVQVERNCANAHERNLKGFAFARLYKEASDNESAKRYLEAYISESEGDFRGHCLMGQLYEGMGQLEKAVASYRRSLELNNTQKELVLKVVKLYCSVPVHPDRARAWADRGARLFPGHPDVFHLRLHLLESAEVVDYEALEDLISEEVSKRPREVDLHVRLVRLYAVRGRLDEAFSHCVAVLKTKAFKDSLEWVACCVEMFEKYLASLEKHSIKGEVIGSGNAILDVQSFLLIALCQFVELNLSKCEDTREVINALYRLDHCLFMAHGRKIRQSPRRSTSGGPTEWDVILMEMKAQLYMHCGTLLIRLAKEKFVTWPRGLKLACTCYLVSTSIAEPETKTPWVARAPKNKDPLKWYVMACSRLSQTGHFLMATRDRHGAAWINTCHTDCCSRQGQQDILNTVYRDERELAKSFLACDRELSCIELSIPEIDQLVSWDEVAVGENPRSLENITWVGLHWYQYNKEMRPGVGVMVKDIFQELRLDVPSIEKHITPNMLCLRDLEAFVYAVVRTTAARVLEDRDIFYEDYEPQVLPQPLCSCLSLPNQQEWWNSAYNLYTGKFSLNESGKIRRTVQLGIEKIRAVDQRHGLQVQLLIYLANAFGSKASYLKESGPNPWYYEEHWKSLEKWSMHYYRQAVIILEMLEKDESIPHCEKPLFPHMFDTLPENEVKSLLQSVRLTMGGALMKEGKLFEAMELFEQVKTPPGLYNLAQVYKYLAHVEARAATEETDTESTSPSKEYYQNLYKVRELLQAYLKMTNSSDVGRKVVIEELSEIEALIRTGIPRSNSASGQHHVMRQHSFPESHSSTNVSDVQESDDNFWVEQPQDSSTKDLIAKLSEVTLNNGYLQEQMAIRDEAMSSMCEQIQLLQKQISMLQASQSGNLSLSAPSVAGPSESDQTKPMFESTPVATRQMSASKSVKPLSAPSIKGPLKIDSNFFAGLSTSNSPEKRVEQDEELATSPTSPGRMRYDSSASYSEDIHFEPLIPLPEQVEVQTGEEDEEVMFSSRAKLYRYDKEVSAWKERGIGTLKILYNSEKGRSRILMRREVVHKICANHFITDDMKLTEKTGTANTWIWNTFADFSEEIAKPEQLAVRFKTPDEFFLFKEKFEHGQKMSKKDASKVQETTTSATSEKSSDLMAKFAPKPGSWSCSVCLVSNVECTTVCVACGAAKLSDGSTSASEAPKSGFHLPSQSTSGSMANTAFVSSASPFTFGKSNTGPVSSSPFTFGKSDAGPENSSPFTLGKNDAGAVNSSPFTFGKSDAGTGSSSPFTFGKNDAGAVNTSSPFTFRKSDAGPTNSSPFTFGVPSSATDENSSSEKAAVEASQVVGASSKVPSTSAPPTSQPFVLATFGIPAIGTKTSTPTFTFASQGVTGSSPFSFSMPEKAASENTTPAGEKSVFGGGTPEQSGPAVSFGSFNRDESPGFDLDLSNHSTTSTQTDPLVCEKCESDNQVTPVVSQQPHLTHSFGTPTRKEELSEQKLFWQQPTGTFQFGQLDAYAPLGGATTWAESADPWHQATQPFLDSEIPLPQNTLQTSEMFSQPFTLQGAFTSSSRPEVDFSSSELLRLLAAAKQQQDSANQESQAGGFNFTPYVVNEPGEETSLQEVTKPISTVIVEECDDDEEFIEESEDSTDESLSYTSTEGEDDGEENEDSLESSSPMPPMKSSQTQPPFSPSQGKLLTTPLKPVPIHSTLVENTGPANLPTHLTGRRFLTPKSPLKSTKKQDEDCLIVYEVRASMANREKASRLWLPVNFFNYTKQEVCSGCLGCSGITKETAQLTKKEDTTNAIMPHSEENVPKPEESGHATHVFGESSIFGQLTFSSLKPKEGDAFSQTQKKDSHKPFQGAGTQLFAAPGEDVEGQDDDKLHFEPIIPLPDEIQVVTGEEGLEVLFSERAKLYRFDADSGQWKERGVGDVKLLRHPKTGQGRVLMRREHIKKLCANHNINAGMELKPNVGSDRSWVWYTPADYAEGEARPEKLAIKLKSAEIAGKFKEVFEDLQETLSSEIPPETEPAKDQQGAGCTLYKEFMSTFVAAPDAWTCEVCYVENNAADSKCIACSSIKSAAGSVEPLSKTAEIKLTTTNVSVVDSVEPNAFQDFNKDSTPATSIFQSPRVKGLGTSQLFTIGRGESADDKQDDEIYLSPSKTSSPSKQGTTPQKPSTPHSQESLLTNLPFGTNTPAKFTFSLQVSPKSPPRKPKSPLSPRSPLSPESPGQAEDDGPYFEPLIPLPDKVECRTGEEGQEVLFCDRCKLFRYDSDASQWKERGIGDIKILLNPSSGKYRILMRREHVFKLCANHMISADMELKPFPNSDKAWLWTTLADFSDEVSAAETLGARFRTNEIATQFKDAFDKVLQSLSCKADNVWPSAEPEGKQTSQGTGKKEEDEITVVFEKCRVGSSAEPEGRQTGQGTRKKEEDDITVVFEKGVTDDQRERAKRLELPSNFFVYEGLSPETCSSQSETVPSKQVQPITNDDPEEISTPSKSNFLFGSASVSSLSFQSVATSSLGSSPFGQKTQQKSPGFSGAGSLLFAARNADDDHGTTEGDHDPHYEPVIPLPDKIDVKTGEEDEEVMFSHRAKLYRFIAEDKQWKERGVGDIKLLRNRQSGKMRVLMRRDQVLKICANHQITTDMKLQPSAGSEKSWVWSTLADFSEQECKAERLAVRFKSEDIAKQFKEKFEECQEMLKNQTPVKPIQEDKKQEEVKEEDLLTKFKAAEGSWECDICMVRNDSDKVECVACGTLKPGAEPRQDQKKDVKPLFPFGSSTPSTGSGFTFGSATPSTGSGFTLGSTAPSAGSGFTFGSGTTSTGSGFTFGLAGNSQGDEKPVFTFGSLNPTPNSSSGVPLGFGSFKQGEQQTEDNKGSVSASVEATPGEEADDDKDDQVQSVQHADAPTEEVQADDSSNEETTSTKESDKVSQPDKPNTEGKFLFGSSSISSLSFHSVAETSLTSSPFGQKPSKSSPGFVGAGSPVFASPGAAEHDGSATEHDHDGPHFEPIIPLPDKIDVKTGEEDEEVMFSHRAKLYRFVSEDKQWKERGVGDIKLLRNRQSGKMRVLMRRDQVLKICANHQITTDMKLQPNAGSEKSWVWSTLADFSEQECKAERLAVRFKSDDIAKQFKEKFEECQEMLKNQTPVKPIQEDKKQEEVKEDLLTKFKAAEGSWECDSCMVRNDSDKIECVACGTLKPGAEPSQGLKKDVKPLFSFGSAAPSSGTGFTFGSATPSTGSGFTFGSSTPSTGSGFTFGSATPSAGSGISFGSAGTSQGDAQSVFSFGSLSQTPFSSPAVPVSFGSFKQEGNLSEQTVENKKVVSESNEQTPCEDVDNKGGDQPQNVQEVDATTDEAEDSNEKVTASGDPSKVEKEEKPLSSSGKELLHGEQDESEKLTAVELVEGDSGKPLETTDETYSEEKASVSGEEEPVRDIPGDRETEDAAVKEDNESEAKLEEDLKQDETKQPEVI
ncbi:E3 SUMO-protein ligase RanBP2-like isoform X2 [Oculina patagonica]